MKLILFAGIPGTGKSTLAEAVGRETQIPVFALDWLLGALRPLDVLTKENAAEVGYALIGTLTRRQFLLGQSVILDSPAHTVELRERWRAIAREFDATVYGVETICSDPELHQTRVEGRTRGIPGWHEISWAHVEKMRAAWESWDEEPHLTVDSVQPLDKNVQAVLAYIHEP